MDQGLLTIIEVLLRIALGLRILYSGGQQCLALAPRRGWQNNLVLLLVALFFSLRGSVAFGLDNLFK